MQSGWRVGSLFNIPFFIDRSWFLVVVLIAFVYGSDPAWQEQVGTTAAWGVGLLFALLLFGSVLLHELGHSLIAQRQGIQVNSITLFLFGGVAAIDKESKTPGQAFQVAIAGPLVSLFLFLALTAVSQLPSLPEFGQIVILNVARTNLVLALFNLIPGLPLDGGQVLKSAVWKATGSRSTGIRWAARTGQILGWTAIGLGVLAYLSSQRFELLWIALIGWFAVRNASTYSRVTDLQDAIASLKAADATVREFRVLNADMTLRQFADEQVLQNPGQAPIYFAASDGRYRGLVSAEDLRTVERSEWETRTLHSIAHPLLEIPHVQEDTPLNEVISQLEESEVSRLTVLTPADAVAGTVDRGDIVRALAKKMNFRISEAIIQRIKEEGSYPAGLQLAAIAKGAE
ncbi:site-2 protease family protein [Romeria aff. gracilis LEGE 07310]|uniref:Zinc metalloprotease n=1 Tax=Vasconcelosia minhoensis LEGE 07310 TaxID=915328 RepID=A0A8J7DAS4_9CYAN|nr:site-2 protease family protein [Romeria gracilis]MBE9076762.1 site-2 protease family protein [Romeria aff. gracilis LEGE 07310]